jgi:hypothetical protein
MTCAESLEFVDELGADGKVDIVNTLADRIDAVAATPSNPGFVNFCILLFCKSRIYAANTKLKTDQQSRLSRHFV